MKAFADAERARFIQRLIEHVETAYPEKIWELTEAELRELIETRVGRAEAFPLVDRARIATYVDLTFELTEQFELETSNRMVREILDNGNLTPEEKIDYIERAVFVDDV